MASVLKSANIQEGTNTAQAEVFNWDDIASRAREYIDRVREQSQKMLDDTRIECERLRTEAHEQGIKTGESHIERLASQMAGQVAEQRVIEAGKTVRVLCEDLENATQEWLKQWQHETVPFAIAIAEKLIGRHIEANPEILLRWIEDSVRLVQGQRQIQLKIHTADALRLSSALPDLLEDMRPAIEVQVVEDDSIGQFGIVLHTPETTIDRTLQTQLQRLKEELAS